MGPVCACVLEMGEKRRMKHGGTIQSRLGGVTAAFREGTEGKRNISQRTRKER